MNQPLAFDVRQEADYVLGMMEMYESDAEIAGILRTKGLTSIQINEVIALVRMEGYQKRLRQAKKIMLIGFGLTILALLPYLFFWNQMDDFTKDRDRMGLSYARTINGYLLYFLLYSVGQSIYGTYRYFLYRYKIQKVS
jgi:multisubunit Na+/H+ antiporter MnhG subunit